MKAFILSGGEGTRLRPFTLLTPKSLLPLANKPFVSYQFELLRNHGVREMVFGIQMNARRFRNRLQESMTDMSTDISFSCEREPRGTGGAIKQAEKFLDDQRFFVLNGDILTDIDLSAMAEFHREKRAAVTIACIEVSDPSAFGLIRADQNNQVTGFIEKPSVPSGNTVNAGIYLFEKEILKMIPAAGRVSVERETFPAILNAGLPVYAYLHKSYWLDVGTCEKFLQAHGDLFQRKIHLGPLQGREKMVLQGQCTIASSVDIQGRLACAEGSLFEEGVQIKGWASAGKHTRIRKGSLVENSLIMDHASIGENCRITNSIIGSGSVVGEYAVLDGIFLADKSRLGSFTRMTRVP